MKFGITLPLLVCAVLVLERLRGQRALRIWAREMTAEGAFPQTAQVWPAMSVSAMRFATAFDDAVKKLSQDLRRYGGSIACIVPGDTNRWLRGSQRPDPVFVYPRNATSSWAEVSAAVRAGEPALFELRNLLQNAPGGVPYDSREALQNGSIPNLVSFRIGAHALQTAAICDLHYHDLAGAISNIVALEGLIRVRDEDPTLVSLMVRFAVLGITVDVLWDALQEDGWSEEGLKTVQALCEQNRKLLSQLPRAMDAERLEHLEEIEWFRKHSYNQCIARDQEMIESFGVQAADIEQMVAPRFWREWVFHPLWSFAWADQEKLQYLKAGQRERAALRQPDSECSWQGLEAQLAANERAYREPVGVWRFYRRLPLRDEIPTPDRRPLQAGEYPYVSFSRAWFEAMRLLTLNEMAVAAVAIKRYELEHGKWPSSLTELPHQLVEAIPRDFMDGKHLRYRLRPDGTYNLYSVGANVRDDGGNAVASTEGKSPPSPWTGADWVWQ